MAALEPYYFEPNTLHTSKMIAVKIVKWIIAWKKYILLTLWRMQSQLKVFLLAVNFESDGMTWHKHGLAAKYSSKMAISEVSSFETNFFRIAGTSEAEISVSGKAECLLATGEDKKSEVFGVTSFNNCSWHIHCYSAILQNNYLRTVPTFVCAHTSCTLRKTWFKRHVRAEVDIDAINYATKYTTKMKAKFSYCDQIKFNEPVLRPRTLE